MNRQQILSRAEDVADEILRKGKHVLPHLARFCLVSTFLEDGVRMWTQWGEQRDYISDTWGVGWFLGVIFVLINLLFQLGGSILILIRKQINLACGILFFVIFLQTIAYSILWDVRFLFRNLALVGAVILLLAEARSSDGHSLFAGLPSLGNEYNPRMYMQLSGRILLVLMYVTLLRTEKNIFAILHDLIGAILIVAVAIGYKTKLSSLVLVVLLTLWNLYHNNFWHFDSDRPMHDFLKYDFFQSMSVIGGLLLVVSLGPGGVSLDEYKKRT